MGTIYAESGRIAVTGTLDLDFTVNEKAAALRWTPPGGGRTYVSARVVSRSSPPPSRNQCEALARAIWSSQLEALETVNDTLKAVLVAAIATVFGKVPLRVAKRNAEVVEEAPPVQVAAEPTPHGERVTTADGTTLFISATKSGVKAVHESWPRALDGHGTRGVFVFYGSGRLVCRWMLAGIPHGVAAAQLAGGLGDGAGGVDRKRVLCVLRSVLALYGLVDASSALKAGGEDEVRLQNWFFNVDRQSLHTLKVAQLLRPDELFEDGRVENAWLCAMAQAALGTTAEQVDATLAAGGRVPLSADALATLQAGGLPPPTIHLANLVVLGGGKAAEYHLYGGLAVVAAVEAACRLSENASRESGILCSQAAHFYSVADTTTSAVLSATTSAAATMLPAPPRRVLRSSGSVEPDGDGGDDDDPGEASTVSVCSYGDGRLGGGASSIAAASLASLVLTRPDAFVKARGPRRECLGGAALAAQGDGYVPDEILIGGDPSLGCALAFCLADLWSQLLNARCDAQPTLARRRRDSSSGLKGFEQLLTYCRRSNETYALGKNNYNMAVHSELGHVAYKGVHLVNLRRNWYTGVANKVKRQGRLVNVFDSMPFYDPDPDPSGKDTANAIAAHFGVTTIEFLKVLQPHAHLALRSLHADATIDAFYDGAEFVEAGVKASLSPGLKFRQGMGSDVECMGSDVEGTGSDVDDERALLRQALSQGCLCTGVGFVFKGYEVEDGQGGKKATNKYAGTIYVIEVTFKSPTSAADPRLGRVNHMLLTHHSGGTRDSQSSSICAPVAGRIESQTVPRGDKAKARSEVEAYSDECKAAVGAVKDRAVALLRAGWPRTRGEGVINLRDSFLREIDKHHIDEIVRANGLKEIKTTVPNFYMLDPDHRFYGNVKYASEHRYKGVKL